MIADLSGFAYTFEAFYTSGGIGATGLTVTVDVYRPDGTKVVSDGSATETGGGLYRYAYVFSVVGDYRAIFKTTDTTVDQQHLPSVWVVLPSWVGELIDNTETTLNSLSDISTSVDGLGSQIGRRPDPIVVMSNGPILLYANSGGSTGDSIQANEGDEVALSFTLQDERGRILSYVTGSVHLSLRDENNSVVSEPIASEVAPDFGLVTTRFPAPTAGHYHFFAIVEEVSYGPIDIIVS